MATSALAHPTVVALARVGMNTTCIDCGHEPLDGGLRCLPCFKAQCGPPKPALSARPSEFGHVPQARRPRVRPGVRNEGDG